MAEFAELVQFKDLSFSTLLLLFVSYIIFKMLKDDLVSGKRLEKEESKNERLLEAFNNQKDTIEALTEQTKDVADNVASLVIEQSTMNNKLLDGLREAQK